MSKSLYAQRMARLGARIFGEVARPTDKKSMKVVQMFKENPIYKRPDIVKYYNGNQRHMDRLISCVYYNNLFKDDHKEFKAAMAAERIRLGKKPKPKKGEGKRALKRAA